MIKFIEDDINPENELEIEKIIVRLTHAFGGASKSDLLDGLEGYDKDLCSKVLKRIMKLGAITKGHHVASQETRWVFLDKWYDYYMNHKSLPEADTPPWN